ncbi:MAG: polysaccharide biosynthesis/export family protein [Bacteroidales bacterium]|jgi:polysaccharide export outer membrane protein|nr:polysaccharide biosynthesis/export family protein [Bacteroidales bacterium]
MRSYRWFIYLIIGAFVIVSCTPQKDLMYLQLKKNQDTSYYEYNYTEGNANYSPEYLLKERDVLYITIQSTANVESNRAFLNNNNSYSTQNESSIYLNSYVIDKNGEVNLPNIGKVKLTGLSVEQARQKIEDLVAEWIVQPVVMCKMVNFKVSVLGDVNRPGTYTFYQGSVNVFEVISAAGDLTYYGNRAEVKIVRKTSLKDEIIEIDLRDVKILTEPKYYLQPGDILYVRSNKVTKSLSYFSQPLSTITSSLGLITTIVTLIFALKK